MKKPGFALLSGLIIMLCTLPFPLLAQESSEKERESGGEIRKWDVNVDTLRVPQSADAASELREEAMYRFPEGTGAYFNFTSRLEPWEYLDLYLEYPDDAWKPLLPYYFGVAPVINSSFYVEGTTAIYDNTGHLVVRDYAITEPPRDAFGGTGWHLLGSISRCWEDWMDEAAEFQDDYMPETKAGIRYFLSRVHIGGIIGGERMRDLLANVNAREISIKRTYRDERIGVFYIPCTAEEWDNWISELYVWVNLRNWRIEAHQVDLLYGREYCDYYNQLWDVQPDISMFHLEWLPTRILDMLAEEYELEITDEPPPGPDEYIPEDRWIKIPGSAAETEGESENRGENETEPSGQDADEQE